MISCIVHTFNESKNLGRCLKSLYFADEIIVIDMGSTDNTLAIAREFNARIFSHPYTGFVEPARNFGIKKAMGDWILVVDADEVIPEKLKKKIVEIIEDKKNLTDYFRLPRKNIIFNKWMRHSGWWPDYQIRFFRKGTVNWSENIHGIPITEGKGGELEASVDLAIIHYNYDSIGQYLERMNGYTGVQAHQLHGDNSNSGLSGIILAPVNEFVKRFFLLEGYKDGMHGLALSLLQSVSETVLQLKLWEKSGFPKNKINLEEFGQLENKAQKIKKYWLFNELLKSPQNQFTGFVYKIRRKLLS